MSGPKQEPDNSEHAASDFQNWQTFKRPGEESHFEYSESTKENIGAGETQHFHYEGNDLPEKD